MQYCRFKQQELEELFLLGPPHPGEIFCQDVFPRLGVSRTKLAEQLGVSGTTFSKFMRTRARVSPSLAAGLARLSGTSALYWLVLQAHHDAWQVQGESAFAHLDPTQGSLSEGPKRSRKRRFEERQPLPGRTKRRRRGVNH